MAAQIKYQLTVRLQLLSIREHSSTVHALMTMVSNWKEAMSSSLLISFSKSDHRVRFDASVNADTEDWPGSPNYHWDN